MVDNVNGMRPNLDNAFEDALSGFDLGPVSQQPAAPAATSTLTDNIAKASALMNVGSTSVLSEAITGQRVSGWDALKPQTLPLGRRDIDGYVGMVAHILNHVRLSGDYPDTRQLSKHLLTVREGLRHRTLGVGVQALKATGLPDYGAWRSGLRMEMMRNALLDRTQQLSLRHALEALERPGPRPDWLRNQDRKEIRALMAVEQHGVAQLESVQVQVVDVENSNEAVCLRLIKDEFVHPGIMQRTTIEMLHKQDDWRDSLVNWAHGWLERKDGQWQVDGRLRKTLERSSVRPLSQILQDIAKLVGSDAVKSVSRGTLSSVWFDGVDAPRWLRNVEPSRAMAVAEQLGGSSEAVAEFTLERVEPQQEGDEITISGVPFRRTCTRTLAATSAIAGSVEDATNTIDNFSTIRIPNP